MALTREKKKQLIEELKNAFSESKSTVFTDPTGLSMPELNEIRNTLREKAIKYKVAKKNLVKLAEKDQKYQFDPSIYKGSIGLVLGYEDEIEPAKAVYDLSQKFENLKIRGGIFENKFIDLAKIQELAQIPSREELYAKLTGSIATPMSGMINVLSGNSRNLVNLLKNYQKTLS